MNWLYGCKLHNVMNTFGDIHCSVLSNGHIADIEMYTFQLKITDDL